MIVYIVGFSIEGNSGKNKATKEKAKALINLVGDDKLLFISNSRPTSLIGKIANKFVFDFKVFLKLLFKKGNYIVIQRVLFMPFTRLLFLMKGVIVINEFHADFKEEIPLLNKSPFEKKLLQFSVWFYNFNYKICDGIIYNHPILKKKFDTIYKKPSIYSYNGSDTTNFYPLEMNIARKHLNITQNQTICLFLGSVSQWHGVDYLIDLFNQDIIASQEKIKLYIVGAQDNPYVRSLKAKVKHKNIEFISPVDTFNAMYYINASDYCMLPVKSNRTSPGSPLKLYDYIACGKPVIAQKDMEGYSDEVERYNLGWVLDYQNTQDAATNLDYIIKNTNFDFEFNNRDIALNHVSWNKRISKWLIFINSLQNTKK
jgi:glycosyltransferase involved in cell wall biosynthesis